MLDLAKAFFGILLKVGNFLEKKEHQKNERNKILVDQYRNAYNDLVKKRKQKILSLDKDWRSSVRNNQVNK